MMTRDDVALRIFCAMLSQSRVEVDLYPKLGEKQIRVCFALAETFLNIASEKAAGTIKRYTYPSS